jgi:hypothetical protein
MLCKINPTLGGATDEKARAINFLRAIQAICTAPAGSTPSVASITTPTASPVIGTAGSVNVITEVISNTEAGGWTTSASTDITSNYNATYTNPYTLDLYRDSGKATYPYGKLSFRTNPQYVFNSTFPSYPYIGVSHGYNTATDATGNYLLSTNWADTDAYGVTNKYRFDVNYNNDAGATNGFRAAAGEWLIASTDRYFIAMSGGLGSTGIPGTMMYVGLRTTNLWEDQYDDNPPLASVVYDGSVNFSGCSGQNASMWARTMQTTGVVNSLPAWYRIMNISNAFTSQVQTYGINVDPLSGYNNQGVAFSTIATGSEYYWGNEMQVPMLPGAFGLMRSKHRYDTVMTGPVSDPATGTLVPPAFPITFARYKQNSNTSGGNAIGLYKSMGGSDTFMQQYYTPGQTFVVNNEAYYAYAIGNVATYRDLFLVRKY